MRFGAFVLPATRRNSPFARGSHSTAPRPPRIRPHMRPHMRATNTPHQTNFARNFQRSFFKHTRKRCNPNDQYSQFEAPSRELRAKFLETTRPAATASLPPNGGNCTIRGTTRRRHADSQLLMLQNPHQCRSIDGLVWFCGPGVLRVVGCYWWCCAHWRAYWLGESQSSALWGCSSL